MNLITLDGTEFKQGMIASGKQSQNIFNMNLGGSLLDKTIQKIQNEIK